jgi:hypothetical protein
MIAMKQLSKFKLDLLGVQEVRWYRGGTKPAGKYTLCSGKGTQIHKLGVGFRA